MTNPVAKGKVRNIYDLGTNLVIETTDRISAFNRVLPTPIPGKGIILNNLSVFWLKKIERELKIPTHLLSANNVDMPVDFRAPEFQNRCMLVRKLEMLPIEAIVRGYLVGSGSAWKTYSDDGTVCGIPVPAGMKKDQKFKTPLYTPTAKSENDENMTYEETEKLLGKDIARQVKELSIAIFTAMSSYAEKRQIIIADTKFEFGLDGDGNVVLADEVLTPDSSRFWDLEQYKKGLPPTSFDKQYVRDWLKANCDIKHLEELKELPAEVVKTTQNKYIEIFDWITGKPSQELLGTKTW